MSKKHRLLAVALACPVVIHAVPVAAQDNAITRPATIPPPAPPAVVIAPPAPVLFPDAQPQAEHFDLYASMREGVDENATVDALTLAMENAWAGNPDMAQIEAVSPGTLAEAARSTRPVLLRHTKRIQEQYRPRIAALFAQYLAPAEATQLAEFYRSESGRRFVKLISRNVSAEASLEDFAETSAITREQLDRDMATTMENTLGGMSPAQLDELERTLVAYPVVYKLRLFAEPMRQLHLQMENEPMLPQDQAEAAQAMTKVFERRLR